MQENRSSVNGVSINDFSIKNDIEKLMKFYSVSTIEALIQAQAGHIERLQAKIAIKNSFTRTYG